MGAVKQLLGAVVATVAVMLLVAVVMAVTEPTAGASVPTVACGDTPGFCPNPPDPGGPWVTGASGDW